MNDNDIYETDRLLQRTLPLHEVLDIHTALELSTARKFPIDAISFVIDNTETETPELLTLDAALAFGVLKALDYIAAQKLQRPQRKKR